MGKHIQKLVVLDPLPRVFGCIDAVTQNKLVESRGFRGFGGRSYCYGLGKHYEPGAPYLFWL